MLVETFHSSSSGMMAWDKHVLVSVTYIVYSSGNQLDRLIADVGESQLRLLINRGVARLCGLPARIVSIRRSHSRSEMVDAQG